MLLADKKTAVGSIKQITLGYTLQIIAAIAMVFAMIPLFAILIANGVFDELVHDPEMLSDAESLFQLFSLGGLLVFLVIIIFLGLFSLAGTIVQLIGLEKFRKYTDKTGSDAIKLVIYSIVVSFVANFISNTLGIYGSFIVFPALITSIVLFMMGYSNLRKSETLKNYEKGREGAELLYKSALYSLIGALLIITIIGIIATIVLGIMSIIYFFRGWKLIREMYEEMPEVEGYNPNQYYKPSENYTPQGNPNHSGDSFNNHPQQRVQNTPIESLPVTHEPEQNPQSNYAPSQQQSGVDSSQKSSAPVPPTQSQAKDGEKNDYFPTEDNDNRFQC